MKTITARVKPTNQMNILSPSEVQRIQDTTEFGLHSLFRQCALAVLNCGTHIDDTRELMELGKNFDIKISQKHDGIQLDLTNAPAAAFVDGKIIKNIEDHLFSVLRDLIYTIDDYRPDPRLTESEQQTDLVYHVLRNANTIHPAKTPNLITCWGGHSINDIEFKATSEVGYQLGLRGFNICTGCGPGVMEAAMKGASIAHSKQAIKTAEYVGLTEPGIIAAESPNPFVNKLVIMPDIEKRLEAFVRLSAGIIVFPGGAGTAEEIMYLISALLDEKNAGIPFPFVMTGPKESASYFEQIDQFIGDTLGAEAQRLYEIIIDDPERVGEYMSQAVKRVTEYRKERGDAYHYNWKLHIPEGIQKPFEPTYENVASLSLRRDQSPQKLAEELRRAMSAIVAGNVKMPWVEMIETQGPYQINGEPELMESLDALLRNFVAQRRMKISGEYTPCYRVIY